VTGHGGVASRPHEVDRGRRQGPQDRCGCRAPHGPAPGPASWPGLEAAHDRLDLPARLLPRHLRAKHVLVVGLGGHGIEVLEAQRTPAIDQAIALLAAGAIVTLALSTGMRKGEILGLEWERVDLSSARISLYRTKNGTPRGVPLNRAAYEALIALEPDPARRQGLCFRKRDDRAWGQIRTAFENAVRRAGLKDVRFHDLRHTTASHLVMRGASLRDVQEILGHRDLKMTQRYAHLSPAHLRAAVDRLDGLCGSAPELAHELAHSGSTSAAALDGRPITIENRCDAPVAQSDRARVS
jgi:integrase